MTITSRRVAAAAVAALFTVATASGCGAIKGIGDSSKDKIKQGGDAGGSTGY